MLGVSSKKGGGSLRNQMGSSTNTVLIKRSARRTDCKNVSQACCVLTEGDYAAEELKDKEVGWIMQELMRNS